MRLAGVLSAGDRVRWTRSGHVRDLIHGEHTEVLSIAQVNVKMRTLEGREIVMARDNRQLHHLDHAHTSPRKNSRAGGRCSHSVHRCGAAALSQKCNCPGLIRPSTHT